MELPENLLHGEWPFDDELQLLQRVQTMHKALDDKIRSLTHEYRAQRFYPQRTEIRSLQLHVHHSFVPPVPGSDDTPGVPGRWTLHLHATDSTNGTASVVNLANHFRKISIELDPRLYSDSIVEWTCFQRGNHGVDKLEVTRTGHTPHSVRVKMLPSHPIDRYAISENLQNAIGGYLGPATSHTKSDIIMATWEYIKHKNLIKEDDFRVVSCDATLLQLFNCESLPFASIVVALRPHLTAAGALDVEYQLTLGGENFSGIGEEVLDAKSFGLDVGHVDEVQKARVQALSEWEDLLQEQHKERELLRKQEEQILAELEVYCRKHEWMTQFAQDPAGFTSDLVRSQRADQQILTAEGETDEIRIPHPHQFSQPWVREIVSDMLVPPPSTN
ncbi:hypothetical protein Poli38472_004160 [Pythium oligandrum]|uniref:DM2 domain-containing protein n=1 Tax=Pythium oligandrum TaxID=41045 RepID=A0A8K1CPK5_PYTOL|nr:hypothetical protein Poli38472_004160 [Pythium oligandrum]|eukprot:TMW66395.1 hypothetical protein Poli38472_004160 [Pythium oligandrum]